MVKDILQIIIIIIIIIIIQIIRKLKNFVSYRLRKHVVESLVLSKLQSWTKVLGQLYSSNCIRALLTLYVPTPSPHPTDSVETVKALFL